MALVEEVILTLPYFGSIDHYRQLLSKDAWIDVHEHYVKQSQRSRVYLCGAQGIFNLSVPVIKHSGHKQVLKDIQVSYAQDWQQDHWRSIRSAYGASPFLMYYEAALDAFFEHEYKSLLSLNEAAHKLICGFLKQEIPLRYSEQYLSSTYGSDLRSRYLKSFVPCPTYIQVFSDRQEFKPGLSILDLVLCIGPEALSYLHSSE